MKPIKARLYFMRVEQLKVWYLCYFDKQLDKHVRIAKVKERKKHKDQYSIKVYEFKYMKLVYEFLAKKQLFGFTDKQVEFNIINSGLPLDCNKL